MGAYEAICRESESGPVDTFRGEDVNLVLSWELSANQNRAFYMQRLKIFNLNSALGCRILTWSIGGGGGGFGCLLDPMFIQIIVFSLCFHWFCYDQNMKVRKMLCVSI